MTYKIFFVLFFVILVGALSGCANVSFKANCNIDVSKEDNTTLATKAQECIDNPTIGIKRSF